MIRLVIYARADLGRECLCSQLGQHDDVQLLAAGVELDRMEARVEGVPVDVVLVLQAEVGPGFSQTLARICAVWPAAEVLLGGGEAGDKTAPACPEGFSRRVGLSCPVGSLVRQLEGPRVGGRATTRSGVPRPSPSLTAREVSVLKHLALGHSSRESAGLLGLSSRTVDGHRRRVSVKLQLASVAQLTRYAISSGLIETGSGLASSDRQMAAAYCWPGGDSGGIFGAGRKLQRRVSLAGKVRACFFWLILDFRGFPPYEPRPGNNAGGGLPPTESATGL